MPPKSGHSRMKSVAYDEYDYSDDGYSDEGGDEMTPEDRERMRQGTIEVREALDSSISVSETEIQEALWYYYYDVDKSVTFLKNKHAPAPVKPAAQPKKQKAASRFDQAAASASGTVSLHPMPYPIAMDHAPLTAAEFFKDVPWFSVPAHRLGNIMVEPLYPRGGLLGGSSKLAQLAAARKKKAEEAKAASASASAAGGSQRDAETDQAISLLSRLSVKGKENTPFHVGQGEMVSKPSQSKPAASRYPSQKKLPSPLPVEEPHKPAIPEKKHTPAVEIPDLRAPPSIFAATMVGTTPQDSRRQAQGGSLFPLPYAQLKDFTDSNPFSGPSPDDVVVNAQAKGNQAKKGTSKQPGKDKTNGLAEGVSSLSVQEAPKVKSKNLNVLQEFERSNMKRMANFVVIGHVDHGKSTLMGRLLYDLKVIDKRSVDKLRKEAETIGKSSFALAWVMDQTSEERSRGVTVDIATNYFETDKTRFTILDAPGHKDFIPNMIAGASQADFAVLVIDASTNSFESGLRGQTKEHALLVRSMGVQRIVVVVNKMDTVLWNKDRFDEISQQMTAFLVTANFQQKNLTFVPCAGLTGDNIAKPPAEGTIPENWYTGPTLVEALDASEPAKRALSLPLRLTISDVFRGGITNPVSISGRLDSGSLQVGDTVLAMPSGESATIKGIEVENEPVDWAVAGQIPTLHLQNIDPIHLRLGDIICPPSSPITNTKTFQAKILAFEDVFPMAVDVFRGRMNASGKVVKLVATLSKGTGEIEKKRPKIIASGAFAKVVVELEKEMPLEVGTRIVLRAEGNTVAAGLLESV